MNASPPKDLSPEQIRSALQPLWKEDKDIRIAYLFGSHLTPFADGESDIDLAVLLDRSLSKDQRFDRRFRLMRRCAEVLKRDTDDIDLIILNDVPVLLQYNVTRAGGLLYEADRSERILYEAKVWGLYEDEAYALRQEEEATLERVRSFSPSV